MQYKLRKNLITAGWVSAGALALGLSTWAIVYSVQVKQRNKPYNKYYFQNINGVDVYFSVENAGDYSGALFANKYVEIKSDVFVSSVDNKIYIDDDTLLKSLDINYKLNTYDFTGGSFYPSNLVDGQTKIKYVCMNSSGDGLAEPVEITFFERTTNGEQLQRVGFFLQRPTRPTDLAQSEDMEYRVTEGGEDLYYTRNWNSTSYLKQPAYHHAKRYSSSIISPSDYNKPIYYRFLDDYDFSLNEPAFETLGLKDNNVELVETLPEGILENNTHIAMPSSYENETYYIKCFQGSGNAVRRWKRQLKGAN